jgi:hypothetical protein
MNEGPAKAAILDFVRVTTEPSSKSFVPPEDRIATFDQDGTLWVEHPLYTQAMFALDRAYALAPQHPEEWQSQEPFRTVSPITTPPPSSARSVLPVAPALRSSHRLPTPGA